MITSARTVSDQIRQFLQVRETTERLAARLTPEDQQLQSMPNCSPTKWHRAHTTWFFETFVLQPRGITPFDPAYSYLFNSYYEAVGPRHARPRRGMLSRPTAEEIGAYRRAVDAKVVEVLEGLDELAHRKLRPVIELGLNHEQQHQELILTDILHAFSENPAKPVYAGAAGFARSTSSPLRWLDHPGGLVEIGALEGSGFLFDNESPRHKVWLEPFALGSRLVTVGEVKGFIREGGYRNAALWLSEGIDWARANGIDAPGYARMEGDAFVVFGLSGERVADDHEPATRLSFYEAEAIARYLGARLPSEAEWEVAAAAVPIEGNFLEDEAFRAMPAPVVGDHPAQMFGDAWEWTRSSYEPYPGYAAAEGALGEYNGKFMANQYVLRGGSAFTPRSHIRGTYRNFWHPDTRFQLTGLRLAKSR